MTTDMFYAIVTAFSVVAVISALIFASEIPKIEEEYREKLKNLDKFTEDEAPMDRRKFSKYDFIGPKGLSVITAVYSAAALWLYCNMG